MRSCCVRNTRSCSSSRRPARRRDGAPRVERQSAAATRRRPHFPISLPTIPRSPNKQTKPRPANELCKFELLKKERFQTSEIHSCRSLLLHQPNRGFNKRLPDRHKKLNSKLKFFCKNLVGGFFFALVLNYRFSLSLSCRLYFSFAVGRFGYLRRGGGEGTRGGGSGASSEGGARSSDSCGSSLASSTPR
jgi:hypothetical protein